MNAKRAVAALRCWVFNDDDLYKSRSLVEPFHFCIPKGSVQQLRYWFYEKYSPDTNMRLKMNFIQKQRINDKAWKIVDVDRVLRNLDCALF